MTKLLKPVLLMAAGSMLCAGCVIRVHAPPPPVVDVGVGAEVTVGSAPPPPQADVMVASPGPDFIWIGGAWFWDGGRWIWHPGYWGRPPHPGMRWYGPHYVYRGGRHIWVSGGWR